MISYQGALEPTKMCSRGRAPGSPSIVPTATSAIAPECALARGEPQRLQKHLVLPGEDSYSATKSSPDVHRNRSGLMIPQVANAAPWDFLHIEQWQLPTNSNGPLTS